MPLKSFKKTLLYLKPIEEKKIFDIVRDPSLI